MSTVEAAVAMLSSSVAQHIYRVCCILIPDILFWDVARVCASWHQSSAKMYLQVVLPPLVVEDDRTYLRG